MNALHERRKPKYPKLQAAAIVAILALLALAWVALSPGLFSTPFPGVFIAALLGLIWFYVAYQGVKKIYSLMME